MRQNRGYQVTAVKIDPYLNIDAGTMNPAQHGQVFVLRDGSEVDLDLGNYERFLDIELTAAHNITTGKVYRTVIEKERRGDFLGETVQIIPHITDQIKTCIRQAAEEPFPDGTKADVCLVEVGGTVGDIESMPFLEAIRQMRGDLPAQDYILLHVTLIPEDTMGDLKTKPTQHSVKRPAAAHAVHRPQARRCRGLPEEEGLHLPGGYVTPDIQRVLPKSKGLLPITLVRGRDGRVLQAERGQLFPVDVELLARWAG